MFCKHDRIKGAVFAALLCSASMPAFAQQADTRGQAVPSPEDDGGEGQDIIVTGTRATGITAAESAAPIKILDSEALSHVGQPNLNQVLTQLLPSFNAQAYGQDAANLTLSARLRGTSPNHTLVLVNGKRRHGTASLAVLGSPFQGAAAADLDLIAPGSIKRIEVLEDGAAAQYGSDAIAGVINIILKDDREGGDLSITGGRNYDVGGDTLAGSLHLATRVGEAGYFNVTALHRYHDYTQIGGLDQRVTDRNGVLRTTLTAQQQALYRTIPGFPYVTKSSGDARSYLTNLQYNSGYDFGEVEAYSFGTYSRRIADAFERLRVPDRVVASPVLGVRGTLQTAGALMFDADGFSPRLASREEDFSITGGIRGKLGTIGFDLSSTYGQDRIALSTLDSANASLFVDTHFTPRDFYDGMFKSTEYTVNADFTTSIDAGLATPLLVAFGGEFRRNTYAIGAGDAGSTYKEGGQSFPGFRPSDAGVHGRDAKSLYVDLAFNPLDRVKVDAAGRFESYSDFGNRVIGKLTSRYDITDRVAVRGTVSTGFRAPTMAESYYSSTNVAPTSAFVQLPANSAAAKLLGFDDLKPERSVNLSLGTVLRPASRLTITLDAYQIKIADRILGSGQIYGSGGSINFASVTQAIIANGNVLDSTAARTGINIFTNGADTRTRGIDLVADYSTRLAGAGRLTLSLAGNYNITNVTRLGLAPSQLTASGASAPIPLFDRGSVSDLETASPRVKVVSSANWQVSSFTLTARGTFYGVSSQFQSPDGGTFYRQRIAPALIGDVEFSYEIGRAVDIAVGANNIFDQRPPSVQTLPGDRIVTGGTIYDAPLSFSPYGINGGYYYARVTTKF